MLKICLDGIERLKGDHKDIEFIPFAVYSDDSEKKMLDDYGVRSLKFSNEYLGRKKNAGLSALMDLEWDYLLEIGSDDLISSKLIDLYKPMFEKGVDCFGINSCYFIESSTGKVAYWKHEYAIGAGRCIRRDVLDKLGHRWKVRYNESSTGDNQDISKGSEVTYIQAIGRKLVAAGLCEKISEEHDPFGLWSDTRQMALDTDSQARLGMNGYHVKAIDVGEQVMVIDIKSDDNLHKFTDFEVCDKEVTGFSDKEIDGIRGLRQES